MKTALLILVLLIGAIAHAQSVGSCNGQQNNATASSLACSSSLTLQAHDVAAGTFFAHDNVGNYAITLCGNPVTYLWTNDTSVAGWAYISPINQTCTPTVTYGSSTLTTALLNASVWRTGATYPVVFPMKGYESSTSPQSQTGIGIPNYESNDTIVSMMTTNITSSGTCSPESSTFTLDSSSASFFSSPFGECWTSQIMYENFATPGGSPYSNTIGTTSAVNMWSYYFIIRNAMPSIGAIQSQGATTAINNSTTPVSSLSVTLPQVSGNNHSLLIDLWDGFHISSVTASGGVTCVDRGTVQNNVHFVRKLQCIVPSSAPGSPITVTVTPSSGTADYDVLVKEEAGLATQNTIAGSMDNSLNRVTTSTTQSAGPIYLQNTAATDYVDGVTQEPQSSLPQDSFIPASPAAMEYQFRFSNQLFAAFGEAVTVSSAPTSASFSATTGNSLSPATKMYAWAPSAYGFPTDIQGWQAFSNPVTFPFNDPESDAGFYFCGASNVGGNWTLTPSWTTMTVIDGCASADHCIAYSQTPPVGSATFTVSGPGAIMALAQKVRLLGTLDQHTYTPSATSPVTANATSTGTNELALMCGMYFGSSSGTYMAPPSYTSGTNGAMTTPGFSDDAGETAAEAFLPTAGTYGTTWSANPDFASPGAVGADTAIFFTTNPSVNTNLIINGAVLTGVQVQ